MISSIDGYQMSARPSFADSSMPMGIARNNRAPLARIQGGDCWIRSVLDPCHWPPCSSDILCPMYWIWGGGGLATVGPFSAFLKGG